MSNKSRKDPNLQESTSAKPSGAKPSAPPAASGPSLIPGLVSAAIVLVVLGLIGALLISRSGNGQASTASDPAPAPAPAATAAPVAPPAAAADSGGAVTRTYDAPPPMSIDLTKNYLATITTPRGPIVVQLRPDIAPITVNNFVFLAREGFYNGLTWHRVLENFMAQGGDPLGDGTGGPGYSVPAEFTSEILFDRPGLLAMARSNDPNSAGSQFFITTGAAPWLNEQYTIFGEVLEGQAIVDAIPLRDPMAASTPGEAIISIEISES